MEKILLTPEEAAEALNISRSKLYDLLQLQVLRSVKIGKARRIPTEAVHEYVAVLSGMTGA
jgi:excisionase family DNA binding protein